jgi:hypothetical protein
MGMVMLENSKMVDRISIGDKTYEAFSLGDRGFGCFRCDLRDYFSKKDDDNRMTLICALTFNPYMYFKEVAVE